MGPSDEDLVRRYRQGDDSAFEALVERYSAGAVRFARHFVREDHAAEDLAQDGFVKLVTLARRGVFDPDRGRFAPFFFRMLRNLALDRLRVRRGPELSEDGSSIPAPQGFDALERAERCGQVRDLVARLPENERAAITLREFEGLSYREIAEALEAHPETVKTWIFRARRRLQQAWIAVHAEENDRHAL